MGLGVSCLRFGTMQWQTNLMSSVFLRGDINIEYESMNSCGPTDMPIPVEVCGAGAPNV